MMHMYVCIHGESGYIYMCVCVMRLRLLRREVSESESELMRIQWIMVVDTDDVCMYVCVSVCKCHSWL